MYITSQILVFIGLIIDLIGKCLKRKGQVLTFNIIASIFYTLSYVFLISWLGVIVNFLNLVRSLWFVYLTKKDSGYKNIHFSNFLHFIHFYNKYVYLLE